MPIEELQEPYWEKQEGETPNQYCYFLEFLEFPTNNLKDFHQHLHEKQQKTTKINKLVKYQTLRNWAGDKCNKWHIRKQAKRKAEKEDILETLHELDKADKVKEYKKKKEFKEKLLNRLVREAENATLSQLRQGADAYIAMSDDNRVDKEEPTNYSNQKVDVEADTTVEYKGVNNLLEAFYVSKTEWDKRKQSKQ